ncbi:MAG: Rid family hydrolase [Aestuariivita sp.]|nr:Rid family hydrolase [Aestuariivita sp.]
MKNNSGEKMRKRIYCNQVAEPPEKTWSNMVVSDDFFFISGFTARDNDGVTINGADAYQQAKIIFEKMQCYTTAAGASMNDILKLTIFVTNIADNESVWRARAEFFEGDFPACSLVQVAALATPEIFVEIEAIGRIGCSSSY